MALNVHCDDQDHGTKDYNRTYDIDCAATWHFNGYPLTEVRIIWRGMLAPNKPVRIITANLLYHGSLGEAPQHGNAIAT